jgi:hypothetical protein
MRIADCGIEKKDEQNDERRINRGAIMYSQAAVSWIALSDALATEIWAERKMWATVAA